MGLPFVFLSWPVSYSNLHMEKTNVAGRLYLPAP
jgi:hypothetical protein